MLSRSEVEAYLDRIKQIIKTHDLIDVHVHPFEVMFNDLTYKQQRQNDGVYSSTDSDYQPPHPAAVEPAATMPDKCKRIINEDLKSRCLLLSMRQLYLHTGPKVIGDHMSLSGVSRVLLLPVMGADETTENQMAMMAEMFGVNDCRFDFGYCVPNCIENEHIGAAVDKVVQEYNVKALKIHPAVTGINLGSQDGVDRVECMLQACRDNGLSVIVHGGRSPAAKTVETRDYSVLSNLQKVNWSIAKTPVVIAHGGGFGGNNDNFLQTIIPRLSSMLSQHDNLFTDVSGVELSTLYDLLDNIGTERIVFGSDCLYYPQWRTIVSLFHALHKTVINPEEAFVKIASSNPLRVLG